MKKYLSFFRLRFTMGLQYRAAALAGISTQFAWGFLLVMMYRAFYRADAAAFPMSFSATVSYIWLQQAFFAMLTAWNMEHEIFASIESGNIAYEMCRPINIYNMWYARSMAYRLSGALLRCAPILIVAVFLPRPYRLEMPADFPHFLLFIVTLVLGMAVTVSFGMLIYALTFFTISPQGLRMIYFSTVDFFAGAIIPLPFFPEKIQNFMEWLPFASMQNVPLRVYSGSMSGEEMWRAILLQLFWLVVVTAAGKLLCRQAERNIKVQGG